MEPSPFLRPLVQLAGGLGVAQSLAWILLSVIGIASYFCVMNLPLTISLSTAIQTLYFTGDNCYSDYRITHPNPSWHQAAIASSFLYLLGSILWLISSGVLLINTKPDQLQYAKNYVYAWIGTTSVLSVIDLGFGIFFGLNYNNVFSDNAETFMVATASGVMMTIAFRGFVLWIVNVTCAVCLYRLSPTIGNRPREMTGSDTYDYDYPRPNWGNNSPEHSPRVPPWETPNKPFAQPKSLYGDPPNAPNGQREQPDYRSHRNEPQRPAINAAPLTNSQYGGYRDDRQLPVKTVPRVNAEYGSRPQQPQRPPRNGDYGYNRPPTGDSPKPSNMQNVQLRPAGEPSPDYGPSNFRAQQQVNRDFGRGGNTVY